LELVHAINSIARILVLAQGGSLLNCPSMHTFVVS
jgi:hypothetical protein